MKFIDKILQVPSYGWKDEDGKLINPTNRQIFSEAFSRINIFKSKTNWITSISWLMVLCMLPFFYFFVVEYLNWWLFLIFIFYTMIVMGTHGTIWFHRYCTHKSYSFSHPFWRFVTQNLVIKTFPEEMYSISHHVHHANSDKPGDPYNAKCGFWYCMLSDLNHHSIAKDLSKEEYKKLSTFIKHTGVKLNSYNGYKKWGSLARPSYTIGLWLCNWAFWFTVLYLIGGFGLVCAIFSGAMFWFVLVRTFNYTGHGKGKVKHKDGVDFDRSNLSINQMRPGLFTGEWHNNHHLYPASARAGFLPHQLDLAWIYIYSMSKIGAVSRYKDAKADFMRKYRK